MLTRTSTLVLVGVLALTTPSMTSAQSQWYRGQDILEQHLQPGQSPAEYKRMLRELGYDISATNYNTPDYVEYEVVKNGRTYEVQIDLNEDTGRATNIDITSNPWKTDKTQATMQRSEERVALNNPDYILVVTPMFIGSGQDRGSMQKLVRDLENLPAGHNRQFYRRTLQDRGYQITDSVTRGQRTQFAVEKNGQQALLNIWFDDETGQSAQVSAFPLLLDVGQREPSPMGNVARSSRTMDESTAHSSSGMRQRARDTERSRNIQEAVEELEALPVGREKRFYRRALTQRGYQITDTSTDAEHTRFEVEKDGQRLALEVEFDEDGQSTAVEALALRGSGRGSSDISQAQPRQRSEQLAERQQ